MSEYKRTGNPPGRPRKDGLPAGSVKAPEPELPPAAIMRSPFDIRPVLDSSREAQCCLVCYPQLSGTQRWNVVSCKHGTFYSD